MFRIVGYFVFGKINEAVIVAIHRLQCAVRELLQLFIFVVHSVRIFGVVVSTFSQIVSCIS